MIFAAATDENTLFVFASISEAIAYCESIDVEDGGWIFWDHAGNALSAEFLTPNHRGRFTVGGGTYRLVQVSGKPTLTESIASIHHINGNPYFSTLSAVHEHLATPTQVPQHGA
ncbi:hypothetical protein OVA13_04490 [Pseudoxanthomonas sp. SL93]|uniref:hypothetical protein n=1 Tax=Pseudoxanthomonas sp. SL93 TaxID=2995142 RepID=UPI00226E7EE8|nr:hypothetical protein [Pseudoxanthomonas sp. SL93]WAC63717.1 hypothetical protein OVA13_02690 [Pseudoxanthomonas sp. SL93]WAC64046.1 hypothetical protein OVA13_04490 [Pseudoxanthomonas sp. SL93]